ncbi:failed axon connections protein [Aphelenchoides avenae]|nr:failed axon connections protein [Aphelenchus avenae]
MPPLLVKEWQKDVVYLVQVPRAGSVPSLSPYSMKLETWLRMAEVPYKNVSNEFKHNSAKGQIPFVELNGVQIADTNIIIETLKKHFHVTLDDYMNEKDAADAAAYHSLIEETLKWQSWYFGARDNSYFLSDEGLGAHFHGVKKLVFKYIVLEHLRRKVMKRCVGQGIGRDTQAEVLAAMKKTLKALSVILSKKKYFMGGKPSTLDATAFGHLVKAYYCPTTAEIPLYVDAECRNLVDYLERMRKEFWPDWDEATSKLSLDTDWKAYRKH